MISEKPQEGSEADKTPLDIWREVLGKEPEVDKSFFMQGGTSLTAIVVLSHYYSRHWDFSLNDFYRHPTLREQMQMIGANSRRRQIVKRYSLMSRKNRKNVFQDMYAVFPKKWKWVKICF